ncbi:MAG: universal stress protein [Acidobacteriota bacterium]
MKLLIAYDGSENAAVMINDLPLAGFPNQSEALVLSVGNGLPSADHTITEIENSEVCCCQREDIQTLAAQACVEIKSIFPDWQVSPLAVTGVPAQQILEKADQWRPDLIVVGSHRRSKLGRFLLGSVSEQVVREAHCSVRVARGGMDELLERMGIGTAQRSVYEKKNHPVRIIIGMDGSTGALAAVDMICTRVWPAGTKVQLFSSISKLSPAEAIVGQSVGNLAPPTTLETNHEKLYYLLTVQQSLEEKLRATGLNVISTVKEGDPKKLLIEQAEAWGADAIFVGSTGLNQPDHRSLGSVSLTVATNAFCSVEIIRTDRTHI